MGACIEAKLLRCWKALAKTRDGDDAVAFGHAVEDPKELASSGNFDCVLWAGGRRSLNPELRRALGCEVRVGDVQRTLVFELKLPTDVDVWQLAGADLAVVARETTFSRTLRVMLRPGVSEDCSGWLWIFGLPSDVSDGASFAPTGTLPSIPAAMDASLSGCGSEGLLALHSVAESLQQRVRPLSCSARWVDAAYWSCDRPVCELALGGCGCPLVLIGDAASGKPFYTGTTLNKHVWDVASLVHEVDWTHDGGDLTGSHFAAFEERYYGEVRRVAEYHRRRPLRTCLTPHSAETDTAAGQ